MSSRRSAVKGTALFAPLLVLVLALHAWGDPVAGGVGRVVGRWRYPERSHAAFQIRVSRWRSDADGFGAKTLQDFVTKAVKDHGADLGIRHPEQPVKVVLLDSDTTELKRFGWSAAETLKENEGLFDATRRTIFVRMERKIQQEAVAASLQVAAARLLLHDAGSERWEPWLAEGLVGRVEGTDSAALRAWTGDLPSLRELLTARPADFQGMTAPKYARGSKLLVAFLMEKRREDFLNYFNAVRRPGSRSAQEVFDEKFFDSSHLEKEWREWIRDPK